MIAAQSTPGCKLSRRTRSTSCWDTRSFYSYGVDPRAFGSSRMLLLKSESFQRLAHRAEHAPLDQLAVGDLEGMREVLLDLHPAALRQAGLSHVHEHVLALIDEAL